MVSNEAIHDRGGMRGTYQENYVATVDVVLSVSAIALKGWLGHGEISPVSVFGVAGSRDAGSCHRTLVWWGSINWLVGERGRFEQLRLEQWWAEDVDHGGEG